MKYEGTRPSGVDKDVYVHRFVLGKREVELLTNICQHYYENMPNDIETLIAKRRLSNILKGLRIAIFPSKQEQMKSICGHPTCKASFNGKPHTKNNCANSIGCCHTPITNEDNLK